jgi:hypothetical protein
MSDRPYHLTYKLEGHPDGIAPKDIAEGLGATDAMVLGMIRYAPDGSTDTRITSADGRIDGPLSPTELFKFWALLAKQLTETLPDGDARDLCRESSQNAFKNVFGNAAVSDPSKVH